MRKILVYNHTEKGNMPARLFEAMCSRANYDPVIVHRLASNREYVLTSQSDVIYEIKLVNYKHNGRYE